jgi:hypothetical protein
VAGLEGLGNDDRNAKTRLHDTVHLALIQFRKIFIAYTAPRHDVYIFVGSWPFLLEDVFDLLRILAAVPYC